MCPLYVSENEFNVHSQSVRKQKLLCGCGGQDTSGRDGKSKGKMCLSPGLNEACQSCTEERCGERLGSYLTSAL